MKKLRNLVGVICMAVLAIGSVCLSSCSSDDDNDENNNKGGTIEINGQSYPISGEDIIGTSIAGTRYGDVVNLYLQVNNKGGNTIVVDTYEFRYNSSTDPAKGDEISKKGLTVSDDDSNECSFTSGSATVVNTTSNTVTVKFSNLAMKGSSKSYTFNGTATFDYDFE